MENENKWRASRLGKFTASEIHNLLKSGKKKDELFGQTALTYIYEKIAEILTGESKDGISGLRAVEWGNNFEADAIESFKALYSEKQIEYFGSANPQFFPFNAFSGGSPDALTPDEVAEVKCPYVSANHAKWLVAARTLLTENHNEFLAANSAEYYAQIQFNMLCTGRSKGIFISYDPRTLEHCNRLAILHIDADEVIQADMRYRLTKAAEIITGALKALQPTIYLITPQPDLVLIESIK